MKTNLTNLIDQFDPERVVVVAPTMLSGAEDRLAREFPPDIASKFVYMSYATETEKDDNDLVPGLGGDVYERLGFGTRDEKNRYVPEIVKSRRERYAIV